MPPAARRRLAESMVAAEGSGTRKREAQNLPRMFAWLENNEPFRRTVYLHGRTGAAV